MSDRESGYGLSVGLSLTPSYVFDSSVHKEEGGFCLACNLCSWLHTGESKRHWKLRQLWSVCSGDDIVTKDYMTQLGQEKRQLAVKTSQWMADKGKSDAQRMDANDDGFITETEFVEYFDKVPFTHCQPMNSVPCSQWFTCNGSQVLPEGQHSFELVLAQYQHCSGPPPLSTAGVRVL